MTYQFLLFIKLQFTTNAQNVPHLNKCRWTRLIEDCRPLKGPEAVANGLTDIKIALVKFLFTFNST